MTTLLSQATEIFYPSSDGEPLAETSVHVDAIIDVVVVLRQYLEGRSAIVLADQFLYYSQGYPKLRLAPDVMVIFDVPPGPRDNYKIWEEGQVPVVIFEITSEGTKDRDQNFKKILYEQLEVQEYWQFDPKGEWIEEQLRGYRLRGEQYEPITDSRSEPLQLRLSGDGQRIAFYREDTGEKLPASDELAQTLREEILARQQAENQLEQERQRAEQERQRAEQERQRAEQERQRAEQAERQVEQLREQLRSLGVNPDDIPNGIG
ncbi:Uma2 family endonuclease [Kovacikia minuta CCNUW1]|uniref:Uma2 family endonuclease n=1 Tax=Kovacikia minuta TaxID=2931930 RepID=UPI001CC92F3E|nr:Uma2 family endonuclease [Kovacikia minuta]UBF24270.1 Uma2 family endonuclease [Kovacikia minuta CCNUW1]